MTLGSPGILILSGGIVTEGRTVIIAPSCTVVKIKINKNALLDLKLHMPDYL